MCLLVCFIWSDVIRVLWYVLIFIAGKFLSRAPPRCTFAAGASAPVWMPAHLGRRNDFSRWVLCSSLSLPLARARTPAAPLAREAKLITRQIPVGRHSGITMRTFNCDSFTADKPNNRRSNSYLARWLHLCLPGSRTAYTYIIRERAGCVFALLLICIADCVWNSGNHKAHRVTWNDLQTSLTANEQLVRWINLRAKWLPERMCVL